MRAALLLLLCLPASASEPRDPRHDRDGDGVVTGKEERQHRRAERRARRAERSPSASGAEDDGGSTTEEDDKRQAAAAGKASRMADAMKAMLPGADAGALGPGGSGAPAGSAARPSAEQTAPPGGRAGASFAGAPPPSGSSGDPANPKSEADLLLAARGPYAPALEKAGLKLAPGGRGFLRVSDGKPAAPEDLERLRAGVLSMPAALMRRPDLHQKVSPEQFGALQQGLREGRAPAVYKDVAATEKERDFVHSRSCEKMSGECNKLVEKPSYKKGEYVTPEDLARMYKGLEEELAGADEEEETVKTITPRALAGAEAAAVEEALLADGGPAPKAAARARSAAKAEEAAYAATPAFLGAPVRRALARSMAFLSPAAPGSPAPAWPVLGTLGALIALGLFALRRRD